MNSVADDLAPLRFLDLWRLYFVFNDAARARRTAVAAATAVQKK